VEIGNSLAVERFHAARPRFLEELTSLEQAVSILLDRTVDTADRLSTVLFFLGSRCADDFREILLLVTNGFGWGATALLRGMFERSVTCFYVREHPLTVDDFIDYEYVRRWKVLQSIEQHFGISPENEPARVSLRANVDRVQQKFVVPDCKTCQTTRVNHTWSRLDIVSMANKIERRNFGSLIVPAYYFPLGQAHSTFASMASRIRQVSPGRFTVDTTLAESEAERTLEYAHLLLLNILILLHEHFKILELGAPISAALSHFQSVWAPEHPIPE
jgi:hypothetical protein